MYIKPAGRPDREQRVQDHRRVAVVDLNVGPDVEFEKVVIAQVPVQLIPERVPLPDVVRLDERVIGHSRHVSIQIVADL